MSLAQTQISTSWRLKIQEILQILTFKKYLPPTTFLSMFFQGLIKYFTLPQRCRMFSLQWLCIYSPCLLKYFIQPSRSHLTTSSFKPFLPWKLFQTFPLSQQPELPLNAGFHFSIWVFISPNDCYRLVCVPFNQIIKLLKVKMVFLFILQ